MAQKHGGETSLHNTLIDFLHALFVAGLKRRDKRFP